MMTLHGLIILTEAKPFLIMVLLLLLLLHSTLLIVFAAESCTPAWDKGRLVASLAFLAPGMLHRCLIFFGTVKLKSSSAVPLQQCLQCHKSLTIFLVSLGNFFYAWNLGLALVRRRNFTELLKNLFIFIWKTQDFIWKTQEIRKKSVHFLYENIANKKKNRRP